VVRIDDPRAPMTAYLSQKGDLIRAVGPFGMEMRPEPPEVAKNLGDGADIAFASAIPIESWPGFAERKATFEFTGIDLSRLPSDAHQTVVKTDTGWRVTVHPGRAGPSPPPGPEWTAPDIRLQSDDPEIRKVAAEVAGTGEPVERAERLRRHVLRTLRTNAGIGVLRDATEVLASEEGVCRDHAILLATLLRAAGVPARLVSGVVELGGSFYYHAWVEAYLEGAWVAMDSTRQPATVDPTHVKVAQGSVGDAFTSFLLDGARVRWVQGD
jgi:transglutaminase-like putative cysteine protease